MPAKTNRTDSPSIRSVHTYAVPVRQVNTMPGVLQTENRVITDITLAGDYFTGQVLDEDGRRVLRLERVMLESEAARICHRGYDTCIECGSDTSAEPERIRDAEKAHRRRIDRLNEEFENKLSERRSLAIRRGEEILSRHGHEDEAQPDRRNGAGVPVSHIARAVALLKRKDLNQSDLVDAIADAEHWLDTAARYEQQYHTVLTRAR